MGRRKIELEQERTEIRLEHHCLSPEIIFIVNYENLNDKVECQVIYFVSRHFKDYQAKMDQASASQDTEEEVKYPWGRRVHRLNGTVDTIFSILDSSYIISSTCAVVQAIWHCIYF
jgi:hypothetical protein